MTMNVPVGTVNIQTGIAIGNDKCYTGTFMHSYEHKNYIAEV